MAAPDLKVYMREHSTFIRKKAGQIKKDYIDEDPVISNVKGLARSVLVILCRNKQRLMQQAWHRFCKGTGVVHDYTYDVRRILSRNTRSDERRSEVEIEVLWKWMVQNADQDPTGIATGMLRCKTKSAVVDALQKIRLEKYHPGDAVIYQGGTPCEEDGVFTVFSGSCDVIVLPAHSVQLLRLQAALKEKKWDQANHTLSNSPVVGTLKALSGFGELATLTNTKRAASIRASPESGAEILVLPKQPLLDCLELSTSEGAHGKSGGGSKLNEGVDYLRQTGLANRMSSQDLVAAANSMTKRVLNHSEVLFCKGEPVESLFLVLSGDFVLDTGDSVEKEDFRPFQNVNFDKCYYVSTNSILGDEGVVGLNSVFESTAVAISEVAVVFEVDGAGRKVLEERIKSIRYTGLAYRHLPRLGPTLQFAEEINLYSFFNCLRKCIASSKPYRGVQLNGTGAESGADDHDIEGVAMNEAIRAVTLLTGGLTSSTGAHMMKTIGRPMSPLSGKEGILSFDTAGSSDKYEMQTRFLLPPSLKAQLAMQKSNNKDVAYQTGTDSGFKSRSKPTRISVANRSMAKNPMSLRMAMKAELTVVEGSNYGTGAGTDDEPIGGVDKNLNGEVHNGIRYLRDPRTKLMRRMIFGVAMHHAEDAIKYRKKLEGLKVKQHAEESIILDQTHKSSLAISDVEKNGMQIMQKKLHRAFTDFRQRLFDESVKSGTNEVSMANTSTAVQLFSSFAQSLGIEEGGEDDDCMSFQPNESGEGQMQGGIRDCEPSRDNQDEGDDQFKDSPSPNKGKDKDENICFDEAKLAELGLDRAKKIDQYFAWLEASRRKLSVSINLKREQLSTTVPQIDLQSISLDGATPTKIERNNVYSTVKQRATNADPTPNLKLTQRNLKASRRQGKVSIAVAGSHSTSIKDDAESKDSRFISGSAGLPERLATTDAFIRMETPCIRRVIAWNVDDIVTEEVISEDSDIPRPSFYKLRQLESPRGFFEALEQVDFVVRREHRLGNLWNTRYMKVSYQSMHKKALFGGGNHVERNLKGRNRRCTELKDNDYMARHSTAVVEPLDNNPVAEQTKQIDDQNNRRLSTEEESKPIRDLIVSFQNSIHAEDSQNEDCDDDGIGIEDFSGNQNITSSPSQSKDQRNSPVSELVVGPHNSSTQRRFSESNSEQSVSRDTGTLDIIISADPDGSTTSGLHNVSTASLAKPVAMSAAEIARLNLDYPSGSLKSINPSSDAIEKYHETLCTDRLSRNFLDGRKKSNSTSKHQLRTMLASFQEMEKSEQLAQKLNGKAASLTSNNNRKILEQSTKQLYICLDPNPLALSTASLCSTDVSRVKTDEYERENGHVKRAQGTDKLDRLVRFMQTRSSESSFADEGNELSLSSASKICSQQGKQSGSALKEYIRPTIKSLDQEANKVLDKKHEDVIFHAMQLSHENMFKKNASAMDEELLEWQKFSVTQSVKMKTGPQMTLPVLVQSSSAPGHSVKYSKGKRAKRYGSGGMIPTGGDADFKPIEGPPSYLEVFKKHTAKVQL